MMDFIKSIAIAATGMHAQAGRMRIISENIANSESTASSKGGDPYRRRIVTFRDEINRELDVHMVKLGQVQNDTSSPPDARNRGYALPTAVLIRDRLWV